ncbi:VOC family protein [Arthrobacter sp. MYb213]|uniref:VOC family protein n=1 Tax=Arthrobacter sp. MYb213 TaxID=1848595 RepID=UPI000CFDB8D6|nr:VOC family protein [Arthrobacter sp. MYb213]PRB67440.1 VOC family protein [Arthrobacter sp. MYb213]
MAEPKSPESPAPVSAAPAPYILFPGTAAQALERYQDIFGGTLALFSYAEFARTDGPGEHIAHGMLHGALTLYAADAAAGEEALSTQGLMLSLLGTAPPATLHVWFEKLAEGGTILDPLARKAWGASDGQVRDRFGVHWLIGYEPEK